MILYENTIKNFIDSSERENLIGFMAEQYETATGAVPEPIVKMYWRYIISLMSAHMHKKTVNRDCGIRIDLCINSAYINLFFIFASEDKGKTNVILLDMLPYTMPRLSPKEDMIICTETITDSEVEVVHPSYQALSYKKFLTRGIQDDNLSIQPLVYLYDCDEDPRYDIETNYKKAIVQAAPVLYSRDVAELLGYLARVVRFGNGRDALKKLKRMRNNLMFGGVTSYSDDQKIIYETVLQHVRNNTPAWILIENPGASGGRTIARAIQDTSAKIGKNVTVIRKGTKPDPETFPRSGVTIWFYDSFITEDAINDVEDYAEKKNIDVYRFRLNTNIGMTDNGGGLNWLMRHLQLGSGKNIEWDPDAFSIEVVNPSAVPEANAGSPQNSINSKSMHGKLHEEDKTRTNADKEINDNRKDNKQSDTVKTVIVPGDIYYDNKTGKVVGSMNSKMQVYEQLADCKSGVKLVIQDEALRGQINKALRNSRDKYQWIRNLEKSFNNNPEKISEAQNDILQNNSVKKKYTEMIVGYMGQSAWDKISEQSKTWIISGVLAYNDMKKYNQLLDFSGVCVQICKAVEYEMGERLINEYAKYLESRFGEDVYEKAPHKMLGEMHDGKKSLAEKRDMSIGTYPFIIGLDAKGKIKNKYAWNMFEDYCKDKLLIDKSDPRKTMAEHVSYTERIRKDYRNQAAHNDSMDAIKARDCIDFTVGTLHRLGVMLDDYNF